MTKISSRSRLVAAASPLALVLALAATPAWAQGAPVTPPADQAAADAAQAAADAAAAKAAAATAATDAQTAAADAQAANGQQIVVTGFRAALRSSTAKKKNSEAVVESVTAEDVGKLPDNGIG